MERYTLSVLVPSLENSMVLDIHVFTGMTLLEISRFILELSEYSQANLIVLWVGFISSAYIGMNVSSRPTEANPVVAEVIDEHGDQHQLIIGTWISVHTRGDSGSTISNTI